MSDYASIKIEKNGQPIIEFGIMTVPDRKMPFLYKVRGCMIEALAYFRTVDDAEEFSKIIDQLIEVMKEMKGSK